MLGNHPVDVMLLATDLGVARSFYGDTLGLKVLLEDEQFLTFACGGDSRLVVTHSTSGTREQATKASWRVDDLVGEVAWLRARGVQVQDLPELGTVDGVADLGFALAAWFVDPDHNWIGLLQLKEPPVRPPRRRSRRRAGQRPTRPGLRDGGELAHGQCRWAGQQGPNVTGRPAAIPAYPAGLYQWAAKRAAREPAPPRGTVMSEHQLAGATALVTGASRGFGRGFGRGIATALSGAGAQVVGVARDRAPLEELRAELGESFTAVPADAADPTVAGQLIDAYHPRILVLNAGASPLMRPLQHHTWETFSVNWQTDVRIAFHWLRASLLKPLRPGSKVVVISSGAALAGSPLSGGYAGAKTTQRFITAYAQDEANRAGLGITFTVVLPRITPLTDLGRPAVRAYAARAGQSEDEYLQQMGEPLTLSRPARRSSSWAPVTPTTRMPTCSPPQAFAR